MDSELKAKREKLMREIDALTLKKINYNEIVDSEIEAKRKEIEKLEKKAA